MPEIYLYEVFREEEALLKQYLPRQLSVWMTAQTVQSAKEEACPGRVISVRTQSFIPSGWGGVLQGVLTRSTGYDHVLEFIRRTGSTAACGYLPDYCSRAVAEQSFLLLWALLRKLKTQLRSFEKFNRDDLTGRECAGQKVLILGVGRIGGQMAEIAKGLGMCVKGVDIAPSREDVEYVSLEDGLAWAQVVLCALPLTEQTRGMLSYDVIKQSAFQGFLVNIARGEITPTEDLKRLLDEKRLAGVGLDVYEDEALLAEALRAPQQGSGAAPVLKALQKYDNVFLTPHNAFNTQEALERKARQTAEALWAFHRTGRFPVSVPTDFRGKGE